VAARRADPVLDEFQRIARFFAPLAGPGALGLQDDVALIDGPAGTQYVLTTDTIVETVDYFPDDPPRQIAQKLLRVNLSDLAAKGAKPLFYLLTTALPASHDEAWLAEFSAGLAEDQARYGITLLGGDSSGTPGPATLGVTAIGGVASGKAILRSGAFSGDLIYVSGTLGDAALGLKVRKGELASLTAEDRSYLVERYRRPRPRVELGQRLAGLAHAMLDISDGLVADLRHLCEASEVAATIEAAALPLSPAAQRVLAADPAALQAALTGGDDYELLFTAPEAADRALAGLAAELGVQITAIGRIGTGHDVTVLDAQKKVIDVAVGGYRHF